MQVVTCFCPFRPVIGFQEDIEAFGRRELQDFFRRHYGPNNLTIAIVGDVSPDQVQPLSMRLEARTQTGHDTLLSLDQKIFSMRLISHNGAQTFPTILIIASSL